MSPCRHTTRAVISLHATATVSESRLLAESGILFLQAGQLEKAASVFIQAANAAAAPEENNPEEALRLASEAWVFCHSVPALSFRPFFSGSRLTPCLGLFVLCLGLLRIILPLIVAPLPPHAPSCKVFEDHPDRAHFCDQTFKGAVVVGSKLDRWDWVRRILERQLPLCAEAKDDILMPEMKKLMLGIIVGSCWAPCMASLISFLFMISSRACVGSLSRNRADLSRIGTSSLM